MDNFNEFGFEDWIDEGCPVCGADVGEDCFDDCAGLPAPPQMYQMFEQQMAFVGHRVAMNIMKNFKSQLLVEKAQELAKNWSDFIGLATALKNAEELVTSDDVISFFANPLAFKRQYVLWNELGKPVDSTRETWTMFMEAIRNTNGKQT